MKVSELIQKLSDFDGNLEVYMFELQDVYKNILKPVNLVEEGQVYIIESQSKQKCIHIGG